MENVIQTGAVATPSGLIARLERRLDQSRSFGRDVDTLFKQLNSSLVATAPVEPLDALTVGVRALTTSSQWADQAEHTSRAIRICAEMAVTHMYSALQALGDEAVDCADEIVTAWAWSATVPRDVVSDVILDASSPATLRAIGATVRRRGHQLKHQVAALLDAQARPDSGIATARDFVVFHAKVLSRLGKVNEAIEMLSDEPVSDPQVPIAYADIYLEHGQPKEALERLKRCLVVAVEKRAIRERILEIHIDEGDVEQAIEQLIRMLHETGEIFYWELLCDLLAALDPNRLSTMVESLKEESPAIYVEVLIAQGSVDSVAKASRAKTFSYQQLWRIGEFLAAHGSRKAARVYERAFNLQGAITQSKLQAMDFGERIERVAPFFDAIDRPTKLRRLAKDMLSRNKNNIPMRREFERIFGPNFP